MKKAFIILNRYYGWKVVLDDKRHVDCTKPIYNSKDISNMGLQNCRDFCNSNKIEIIRECK